jgi:hypothetical protein
MRVASPLPPSFDYITPLGLDISPSLRKVRDAIQYLPTYDDKTVYRVRDYHDRSSAALDRLNHMQNEIVLKNAREKLDT